MNTMQKEDTLAEGEKYQEILEEVKNWESR